MSRTAWLTTAVMAFRRCLSRVAPVHAELAAELPVRADGPVVEVVDELAVAMERGSEYGWRKPPVRRADLNLAPPGQGRTVPGRSPAHGAELVVR
eukprot:14109429-Heterocapsa_arctica.AAC.1